MFLQVQKLESIVMPWNLTFSIGARETGSASCAILEVANGDGSLHEQCTVLLLLRYSITLTVLAENQEFQMSSWSFERCSSWVLLQRARSSCVVWIKHCLEDRENSVNRLCFRLNDLLTGKIRVELLPVSRSPLRLPSLLLQPPTRRDATSEGVNVLWGSG